jgi:hypothetical protein
LHAHYFSRYEYHADPDTPGRQILREIAAISASPGYEVTIFSPVRTDFLIFVIPVRILQNLFLFSAFRKLIFPRVYVLISCFSWFPYVFCIIYSCFLLPGS